MADSFEPHEFIAYLRRRWWYVPLACIVAAASAVAGSMLVPKKYSATATILIEPPFTSDPRAAAAVSPIYLESLKTYEHLANSDSLFRKAAEKFRLGTGRSESIEALKRRVLRVSKLRDTRILQITTTLPDPKLAAAVVGFLAEETVTLSRSVGRSADVDLVEKTEAQIVEAERTLDAARRVLERADQQDPIDFLRSDVEQLMEQRSRVERELLLTRADLAESPGDGLARREAELGRQARDLAIRIHAQSRRLSQRTVHRAGLQSEFENAIRDRDALRERLRNLRSNAGLAGESLRVIDQGGVPQEPDNPRGSIIALSAAILAFAASALYLAVGFSLVKARNATAEGVHGGHG